MISENDYIENGGITMKELWNNIVKLWGNVTDWLQTNWNIVAIVAASAVVLFILFFIVAMVNIAKKNKYRKQIYRYQDGIEISPENTGTTEAVKPLSSPKEESPVSKQAAEQSENAQAVSEPEKSAEPAVAEEVKPAVESESVQKEAEEPVKQVEPKEEVTALQNEPVAVKPQKEAAPKKPSAAKKTTNEEESSDIYDEVETIGDGADMFLVEHDRVKGDWVIKKKGATRATRRVGTKAEAVKIAKELVSKNDANLTIRKKDGKFQKH
jgi:outer membrane biosynthesis protein TonB